MFYKSLQIINKMNKNKNDKILAKAERPFITNRAFYFANLIIGLPLSIILLLFMVQYLQVFISKHHYILSNLAKTVNNHEKLMIIVEIFVYIGLYVLSIIILTMANRFVFGRPEPTIGTEPKPIIVLNKIIINTIEQLCVFGPLLVHYLIQIDKKEDLILLFSFAIAWIIGRIMFLIGYYFGSFINFSYLRTYGLMINMHITLILVLKFFNIDLWKQLLLATRTIEIII